jgi:hypothetical protein
MAPEELPWTFAYSLIMHILSETMQVECPRLVGIDENSHHIHVNIPSVFYGSSLYIRQLGVYFRNHHHGYFPQLYAVYVHSAKNSRRCWPLWLLQHIFVACADAVQYK